MLMELSWTNAPGAYPTDDLDLILITPGGVVNLAGATLDSPESVVIANPNAGTWTAAVNGRSIRPPPGAIPTTAFGALRPRA